KDMGKVLYLQGQGTKNKFSCIATDVIPSFQLISNGKGFPQYLGKDSIGRIDNFTDSIKELGDFDDDDAFYYIYAMLHSNEYKDKYEHDLIKAFPRIPLLKNKEEYISVGKALVNLHINYENVPVYEDVVVEMKDNPSYQVSKMKHPKRDQNDTIIFNSDITIKNIPEKVKNFGKTPATIMDIKFDKEIKGLGRQGKIESIQNALIAPNQKFITAVKVEEKDNFTVTVTYKDMSNQMVEQSFNLNLGFTSDLMYTDSNNTVLSKDTNALRNMLHQFTKRGL